jgi:ketosteroid isomerase-like protein
LFPGNPKRERGEPPIEFAREPRSRRPAANPPFIPPTFHPYGAFAMSTATIPSTANVPNTKIGRMYEQHIQMILDKDIDGLLNQYAEDAVLISSFEKTPKYFRGRKQLREHFQGILGIQGLQSKIAFWGETQKPDTLMVDEAITMQTADGEANMRFADSWVIEDGKIAIHFAGMVQYPDGSVA